MNTGIVLLLCSWTGQPQEINIYDKHWPKLSKLSCSKECREDRGSRATGFNCPPHSPKPAQEQTLTLSIHNLSTLITQSLRPLQMQPPHLSPRLHTDCPDQVRHAEVMQACPHPLHRVFLFFEISSLKKLGDKHSEKKHFWHMDMFQRRGGDGNQPISHAAQQRSPLPNLSCGPSREIQCGIGRKLRRN